MTAEADPHTHEHVHRHLHGDADGHDHEHPGDGDGASRREPRSQAIDIEHLHYAYPDGFEALRGIDLSVRPGERVALVGPNGAGKSTLMLHLNGINLPSHGSVSIGGAVVNRATAKRIRADVGLVFQDPDDQLFSPTVFDDVAFGPLHMGIDADEIHRRVERALAAVGMEGAERRLPSRLSIGQRKRVALATVLSMDPSILAFDEPSAGLDPRGRRQLIELMASLSQTLIVATHDMRLVADVLTRTVVMDGGLVVADGATAEVMNDEALLEAHGLEAPG